MITYKQLQKEVFDELNISNLPEDAQERIMQKIGKVATQKVTLEILKNLPEDKRAQFKKLQDDGDLPALHDFVEVHVPDADKIIGGAIKTVVDSVKGS